MSQLYITDCEASIVFIDCAYLESDFDMTMEMVDSNIEEVIKVRRSRGEDKDLYWVLCLYDLEDTSEMAESLVSDEDEELLPEDGNRWSKISSSHDNYK